MEFAPAADVTPTEQHRPLVESGDEGLSPEEHARWTGEIVVGVMLVAGACMGLAGVYDDAFLMGVLPAKWLMLVVGFGVGPVLFGKAVARLGLKNSAKELVRSMRRYKVATGVFVAVLVIGVLGLYAEHSRREYMRTGADAVD